MHIPTDFYAFWEPGTNLVFLAGRLVITTTTKSQNEHHLHDGPLKYGAPNNIFCSSGRDHPPTSYPYTPQLSWLRPRSKIEPQYDDYNTKMSLYPQTVDASLLHLNIIDNNHYTVSWYSWVFSRIWYSKLLCSGTKFVGIESKKWPWWLWEEFTNNLHCIKWYVYVRIKQNKAFYWPRIQCPPFDMIIMSLRFCQYRSRGSVSFHV